MRFCLLLGAKCKNTCRNCPNTGQGSYVCTMYMHQTQVLTNSLQNVNWQLITLLCTYVCAVFNFEENVMTCGHSLQCHCSKQLHRVGWQEQFAYLVYIWTLCSPAFGVCGLFSFCFPLLLVLEIGIRLPLVVIYKGIGKQTMRGHAVSKHLRRVKI